MSGFKYPKCDHRKYAINYAYCSTCTCNFSVVTSIISRHFDKNIDEFTHGMITFALHPIHRTIPELSIISRPISYCYTEMSFKLYCGYKYKRPCMINIVSGLKQRQLQVNGHAALPDFICIRSAELFGTGRELKIQIENVCLQRDSNPLPRRINQCSKLLDLVLWSGPRIFSDKIGARLFFSLLNLGFNNKFTPN